MTVSLVKINDRANELIQAITAPVSGQNYLATVKPDGTIDMPVLTERVMAAGHTIRDVERHRQSTLS